MQKLTCLTCRVSLATAENQRDHYKTEWHIYNLKRKLTQLIPLTEEEYKDVVAKHSQVNQSTASNENKTFHCEICSKLFNNEKAFVQHNSSKRHQLQSVKGKPKSRNTSESETYKPVLVEEVTENKSPEPEDVVIIDGDANDFNDSDWEEVDDDDQELEGIPLTECLFCSEISESMESNLDHMSRMHSFFVPDIEFCIDIKRLLNYLGIKIASGFCCLFCSEHGKQFASKKSAQQHMIDKGHTKIKFMDYGTEQVEEFEEFYDYTTSYPDGGNAIEPDELNLDGNDYQMTLPSGNVIGHRSLYIYYKQKLKPEISEKRSKNKELLGKVMSQYKALGWTGMATKEAVQRAKDINHWQKNQQKSALRLGKKHNLSLQPYRRCQFLTFN
ncbi:hypothetical protein RDWZM_009402 [Blomia tropicalis]|uniref:Zinc finger protein 622 n=1 Tax=Blomia tropicalis TaxID=40697 RepID=A0A9Q0RLA3_BLOTA|nr:hypothetical protein BLOT_004966 [Blomia tropicalis]KAJ6218245.1 hypothetical protein RDWZM_009402 [Blomia tropicalis]